MSISLRDLAPRSDVVKIRGEDFLIHAISSGSIATLLDRFGELRKILVDRGDKVSSLDMRKFAPRAICAMIAEAHVPPLAENRAEEVKFAEAGARHLTAGELVEIVNKLFEISFPGGVGPFVETLAAAGFDVRALWAEVLRNRSRSDDTGKEPDTKSASSSSESSDSET